ncbi:hypothetical protein ASD85_10055 [Rhizobium sp. Root651]|nr:hypothetical protein ASD85_10055 [Rhizobium sp. Root651]
MESPYSRGSSSLSTANHAENFLAHAAGADSETGIILALDVPGRLDRGAVDMENVNHGRLLSVAGWPVEHLSVPIAHKARHFSSVLIRMAFDASLPKIAGIPEMARPKPFIGGGTAISDPNGCKTLLSIELRKLLRMCNALVAGSCPSIVDRVSAHVPRENARNIRFRINGV